MGGGGGWEIAIRFKFLKWLTVDLSHHRGTFVSTYPRGDIGKEIG